jgi:hypothetical protein
VSSIEHQDVGGHQHRVAEQSHGDGEIRVLAGVDVFLHAAL